MEMSIKNSCDHCENSNLFSISLSPRRDVAKKRLRSSSRSPTEISNFQITNPSKEINIQLVKSVKKFKVDIINNVNELESTDDDVFAAPDTTLPDTMPMLTSTCLSQFDSRISFLKPTVENADDTNITSADNGEDNAINQCSKSKYKTITSLSFSSSDSSDALNSQCNNYKVLNDDPIESDDKSTINISYNSKNIDKNNDSGKIKYKNTDFKVLNNLGNADYKKVTKIHRYKGNIIKFYSLNNSFANNSYNPINNNIVKYCMYHIVLLIFFNQISVAKPLLSSSLSSSSRSGVEREGSMAFLIADSLAFNDGSTSSSSITRNRIYNSGSNLSSVDTGDQITYSSNSNTNAKSIRSSPPSSASSSAALISSNVNEDDILNDPIVIGGGGGSSVGGGGGHYLDKLDNLERSVAAVLMKVAYGTTSTTKRSIPDNTYVPSLTTIATPPLTTLRYSEKSSHQQQLNLHHRNYELDLERDHALPTSAPNADILKSNSNPTYPNPNRHHNHDRDRHRHLINSTPAPSLHNLLTKGQPTIAMYPGDMPSYSPPGRAFFTPPLPPEYQNPFADKPTLRGTNSDGGIITPGTSTNNQQSYINRRPIPPPSLMPGHERIPFRPPELGTGSLGSDTQSSSGSSSVPQNTNKQQSGEISISGVGGSTGSRVVPNDQQQQRKKTLNTPSQKVNNKIDSNGNDFNGNEMASITYMSNNGGQSGTETNVNINGDRVPNISRILSGSNGKKEDIPEVLLKQVTSRPNDSNGNSKVKSASNSDPENNIGANINQSKDVFDKSTSRGGVSSILDESSEENDDDDFEDNFPAGGTIIAGNTRAIDEPKTQLTIKINGKSTETPYKISNGSSSGAATAAASAGIGDGNGATMQNSYSTQIVHNLANQKNFIHLTTSQPSGSGGIGLINSGDKSHYQAPAAAKETKKSNGGSQSNAQNYAAATWDIAWNIHVYLSVILFTILGVYSIFKMIFYNKLSHLFSQSYFVWIHLILISICVTRIFYLIYDAYNIHSSFPIFISELLLNLPATFLTIAFSVLILFLLIRSLNHKTNRYSALIRPLTVLVGSLVHVFLCVTLHLVESYTATQNSHLHFYYQQQQQYRNIINNGGGVSTINGFRNFAAHHNGIPITIPQPPPRVLSLICQIIYIFVCLSLGLLYLYIYRILKRVLRSKSQNYIHGYQNLSYAIHITIATALLFVLLAALQIFGAISISTTRPINMTTGGSEIDWLQWGYQFSLRLIEIAIIWLMSWVAGLKTGGTSGVLQREKNIGGTSSGSSHDNHHNVSGFALFPCTSSSSQEHFETDYPAVCNANTNLHNYTLRTGKPIYDDNFALNSLQNSNNLNKNGSQLGTINGPAPRMNDFHQQQQNHSDFVRSYDTSSLRSDRHSYNHSQIDSDFKSGGNNESATDHYENPNFELRSSKVHYSGGAGGVGSNLDNCYSEPLNPSGDSNRPPNVRNKMHYDQSYDFQNLERPSFQSERSHSRSNEYNTMNTGTVLAGLSHKSKHTNNSKLDRSSYENPERRSSNSTHSCTTGRGGMAGTGGPYNEANNTRGYSQYNSFDRRNCGVRKSGTLNNIGAGSGVTTVTNPNHIHGRNGSSSSSTSSHSHHRPSGVQTLSSSHRSCNNGGSGRINSKAQSNFHRDSSSRSSLERINNFNASGVTVSGISTSSGIGVGISGGDAVDALHNHSSLQPQYGLPSEDEMLLIGNSQAERTNLINDHCSANHSGKDVTGSTSGGNLNDITSSGGMGGPIVDNNDINALKQQNFLNSNIGSNIVNANEMGGRSFGDGGGGCSSTSGDSANSGSMLVAEHGFVRFRALDDINNAQGVGIHNASIRTTGRSKEKRYTNNT